MPCNAVILFWDSASELVDAQVWFPAELFIIAIAVLLTVRAAIQKLDSLTRMIATLTALFTKDRARAERAESILKLVWPDEGSSISDCQGAGEGDSD